MRVFRVAMLSFLMLCLVRPALPADDIAVEVGGRRLALDVAPVISEGRALVPLRGIFEALGAEVAYDPESRAITAARDGLTLRLVPGERRAVVGGREVELDVPARIVSGRTLVPVRFVAEALGARVEWDGVARTVRVWPGPAQAGVAPAAGADGVEWVVAQGLQVLDSPQIQVLPGGFQVGLRVMNLHSSEQRYGVAVQALDAAGRVLLSGTRVVESRPSSWATVQVSAQGDLADFVRLRVAVGATSPAGLAPAAGAPPVPHPTWWSRAMQQGCKDAEPVQFGSPPLRLADIINIAPYGLMVGAHVIPSDHQGYHFGEKGPVPTYAVLAVADGEIVSITVRKVSVETGQPSSPQYHVTLRHSCSIITQYDLIDQLDPAIAAGMAGLPEAPIPVREGQVIGKIGASANGLDLWVADLRTLASGYVVPQHYEREAWRLYAIDPYALFREPLRSQLLAKSIRRVEPRGGRADSDRDGRLVGGWFVENTNGYAGRSQSDFFTTHLAVAYHTYDPTLIVVSLGDFAGRPKQFAVQGNAPDPTEVSVATGPVKYELLYWDYYDGDTGRKWDYRAILENFQARPFGEVHGTALFELIADRRLRVEIFPGRRAQDVRGFSPAAVIYER